HSRCLRGRKLGSFNRWPRGQCVFLDRGLFPCKIVSTLLLLPVSHRRFDRRLSVLFPLLWHVSMPAGHCPLKAKSTSLCMVFLLAVRFFLRVTVKYPFEVMLC